MIFITFEGGEGAGKSTQIELLLEHLQGRGLDVVSLRDPGGTAISEKIRDILKDKENALMTPKTEVLLYLAARNQMVESLIMPHLDAGKIVLCDRFSDSTLAYQGYAGGVDENLEELCRFAESGIRPDITFLLRINPELGLARKTGQGELDRLELKGLEFHEAVAEGFEKIAKNNPERVVAIDATLSPQEIHGIIIKHVDKILDI